MAIAPFALAGFIIWIRFSTYYVVGETDLIIRSGPLQKRIPLSAITSIEASQKHRVSQAISRDPLRINFRKSFEIQSVLISPKDKDGFLRNLVTAVPHYLDGDRLVREPTIGQKDE